MDNETRSQTPGKLITFHSPSSGNGKSQRQHLPSHHRFEDEDDVDEDEDEFGGDGLDDDTPEVISIERTPSGTLPPSIGSRAVSLDEGPTHLGLHVHKSPSLPLSSPSQVYGDAEGWNEPTSSRAEEEEEDIGYGRRVL